MPYFSEMPWLKQPVNRLQYLKKLQVLAPDLENLKVVNDKYIFTPYVNNGVALQSWWPKCHIQTSSNSNQYLYRKKGIHE